MPLRTEPWLAFRSSFAGLLVVSLTMLGCGVTPTYPACAPDSIDVEGDAEHASGTFAGVDGVTLFEQSWRPVNRPVRASLVMVHGLKDHSDRYGDFARRATREGIAIYAFDLRGHAESAGPRVSVDQFSDYVGDLRIFLFRIREREPSVPLFVFGHSMGGLITAELLAHDPPHLAGAIVSSGAIESGVGVFTTSGTRTIAALLPNAPVFQLDLDDFSRDPTVVSEGKSDPLIYQPAAPAHTAKELLNAIEDLNDHMSAIQTPLLILHGSADKVTPPEGSRDLFRRASSRDKTLKIYHGLYHDLLHEPERWRVRRDVLDWIEARAK